MHAAEKGESLCSVFYGFARIFRKDYPIGNDGDGRLNSVGANVCGLGFGEGVDA